MSLPIGVLQQTFSATQYMIYASLTVLSLLYTYHQSTMPKATQLNPDSRLISYFREGRHRVRVNAALTGFFALVFLATVPLAFVIKQ